MVIQAQGKQTLREAKTGFFGVNLRSDPSDISEGGLAQGLNVDLYATPGVVLSRRGIADKTLGLNPPQRKIIRADDGVVHAGAVTFYDDGVSISSSLLAANDIDMIEFIGQNAQASEVFIANGTDAMFRYTSGSGSLGNWGIASPTVAPVGAIGGAGSLTGVYSAKYTYRRKSGSTIVHESNPSVATSDITLTSEDLDVTVTASTDPDVTDIAIYRTLAGGSVYNFDQEVTNATATIASSQVDGGLGAAVDEDNDVPVAATIVHGLRDRLWTNDVATTGKTNRIRHTKRFFGEAQPALNFVDIGPETTTVTAISSISGVLIVFTKSTKYRVIEQVSGVEAVGDNIPFIGAASNDFVIFELPSSRGCLAPDAVVSVAPGIIYPTKDGIFLTTGSNSPEQLLSQAIQNIFIGVKEGGVAPIDFDNESNMIAEFHRGRYYLSFTSTESPDGNNDYTAILTIASNEWYFWNEGFTAFLFDDAQNEFLAGRSDGTLRKIEEPNVTADFAAGTAITASFHTPDSDGGDSMQRKVYFYFKVDAEIDSTDIMTASFFADDTLARTVTVTGNETKLLQRLPKNTRGCTWRIEASFTGTKQFKFHGVEAQWKPLASS